MLGFQVPMLGGKLSALRDERERSFASEGRGSRRGEKAVPTMLIGHQSGRYALRLQVVSAHVDGEPAGGSIDELPRGQAEVLVERSDNQSSETVRATLHLALADLSLIYEAEQVLAGTIDDEALRLWLADLLPVCLLVAPGGELLLIDAGCEFDYYASDVTRTFPVSGKFTGPQRDVYELVLAAQAAAIDAVKAGNHWEQPHDAALAVLVRGFVDLGLCEGTVDGVIESGDYRRFYMHRTGHWLGLDVHDAGDYKRDGGWRVLEPGMTLTVEPGCYIRPGDDVPDAYWNIGIRIEDDVVVTPQGCEVLTAATPKTVADVEGIVGRG